MAASRSPALAAASRQCLGRIEVEAGGFQLSGKLALPSLRNIHVRVNHPKEVRRDFDLSFAQEAGTAPAQLAGKVSKFKNHVLTGAPRLSRCLGRAAKIIRREKDDGKADFRRAILKFLDDGASLVWLFAKNDRFEAEPLDKPGDGFERGLVMAMDEEDLPSGEAWLRRWAGTSGIVSESFSGFRSAENEHRKLSNARADRSTCRNLPLSNSD